MSETREILIRARGLIEKRKNWMRDIYWADAEGHGTYDPNKVCKCCAYGALLMANGLTLEYFEYNDDVTGARELKEAMGSSSIEDFNDSHSHPKVLAAFDKAISQS